MREAINPLKEDAVMAAPKTQSATQKANADAKEEAEKAQTDAATNGDAKDDAAAKKAAEEAEKESERERKAKEKAEAEEKARQAKIDAGDLIVTDGFEFEKGTKETKVSGQVEKIISAYQESSDPLVFTQVVSDIGAKYPEDLIPAMHALETVGLVIRFDAKSTADGAGNRRATAYRWVGDDEPAENEATEEKAAA